MRTTLDIDDDVLSALKELARLRGESIGKVVSEAVREGIRLDLVCGPEGGRGRPEVRESSAEDVLAKYGFEPLPYRGKLVTDELINQIRDDEGL